MWPSNSTSMHIPLGNHNWRGHVYPNIHCITICNSDIKKVHIWVSSSEVDEPIIYCTEWSNSEREKLLLSIIAYIWNLENSTDESIFRAAKEDVNIKNRLLDRVEEGEGGIIWEYHEAYTLP